MVKEMKKVEKRKGDTETFDPTKIKKAVEKATIDAGYSVEEKKDIINEVYSRINKKLDEQAVLNTQTIKKCILTELDECEPYISKSWRRFDRKYKP